MQPVDPFLEHIPEPPEAVRRPPWANWLKERDIDLRTAGRAVGRSYEWVRRVCLPFDDPARLVPDEVTGRRIEVYTRGAISLPSFEAGAVGQPDGSVA